MIQSPQILNIHLEKLQCKELSVALKTELTSHQPFLSGVDDALTGIDRRFVQSASKFYFFESAAQFQTLPSGSIPNRPMKYIQQICEMFYVSCQVIQTVTAIQKWAHNLLLRIVCD